MPESYEKLRPYWEAWKANNKKPADAKEAQLWDGMVGIFKAVAGETSAKVNQEALKFVLESLPRWRSELMDLPNADKSTNRITLYRGVRDDEAIRLRKALRDGMEWCERSLDPISYSTDIDVAVGHASKGHIDGAVYSLNVSIDSILFSDLDSHYQEGGLNKEREVIVWIASPAVVKVIKANVAPRKPLLRNRSDSRKWGEEKIRLEENEKQLIKEEPKKEERKKK